MTEAKGIPVAEELTGANRHDMTKLADLLDGGRADPDGPAALGVGPGL